MKYKVGDRVRIKNIDWYNKNKGEYGYIDCGNGVFFPKMRDWCGKIATIKEVYKDDYYRLEEYDFDWTDEMIEGLVEEETKPNIIEEAKTYWDSIKDAWICPQGYQFVDENGNVINTQKIVLEKKGKRYPKTYEECCKVLGVSEQFICTNLTHKEADLYRAFICLIRCRDAYWKIAGEEMGLGKPWKPDWTNNNEVKFIIGVSENEIIKCCSGIAQYIFAFPTEEMRDAFFDNFKELINDCKELL